LVSTGTLDISEDSESNSRQNRLDSQAMVNQGYRPNKNPSKDWIESPPTSATPEEWMLKEPLLRQ